VFPVRYAFNFMYLVFRRNSFLKFRVEAGSNLSPASRRRRRKGNPVAGAITGPPCSWGI
jgi:hypothetical protein